jgi:hypothetical protein
VSCISATQLTLPCDLLQLKQLPRHPLDGQLLLQLEGCCERLEGAIEALEDDPVAPAMLQHLLPLGVLPALQACLLSLDATVFSSPALQSDSTRITQGSPLTAASGSGAVGESNPSWLLEVGWKWLLMIQRVMWGVLELHQGAHYTPEVPVDLFHAVMEQLLSNSAALKVLVHRGLSAEVQAAARAGRSDVAPLLLTAVCGLLRLAAATMHEMRTIGGGNSCSRAEEQLGAFLNLEDTLPYLELLCMPLDHGEPYACHAILPNG